MPINYENQIISQTNLRAYYTERGGEEVEAIQYTEERVAGHTSVKSNGEEHQGIHTEVKVIYSK